MDINGQALKIFIGYDSREAVASNVASHSITRHTQAETSIQLLKHRDLRKQGLFSRPWLIRPDSGDYEDLIDGRPFTTEFSHTRFLVPALMQYKGWALFIDSDMIFLSDVKHLFKLCDERYAVQCVQHKHVPKEGAPKMDGRLQNVYHRKNWSSLVLWNCGHPSNKKLTIEKVNHMKGGDLHAFSWLQNHEIGDLPATYNYISGVSPRMPSMNGKAVLPDNIHYTEGGPWFEGCADVPYADLWISEFEEWCREAQSNPAISAFPTTKYDRPDKRQYK